MTNGAELDPMTSALGLAGMIASLALLVWFAHRGWSVLLLAPLAVIVLGTLFGSF